MVTDRRRILRRPRRELGLEALEKQQHLAQQIASVVALSLQQNQREYVHGRLSTDGKQGGLALTLRLAEQNVSDMTTYIRQQEAKNATIVTSRDQVENVVRDGVNVCGICLEGDVTNGENMKEEDKTEVLSCGHIFHVCCIEQWLQYRRVCPMDRQPVD
ncbi:unnamed protein product [Peronospora farinosa]|uniref:RING-type domain-containing protein n=1 Tax=Peronospora farinosa TaxID=134698 RepID=A0AAV0U0Y0_9STRA|nr:unnamed protein product [Peronospora farinosa]